MDEDYRSQKAVINGQTPRGEREEGRTEGECETTKATTTTRRRRSERRRPVPTEKRTEKTRKKKNRDG